jgi:hypothetical protein
MRVPDVRVALPPELLNEKAVEEVAQQRSRNHNGPMPKPPETDLVRIRRYCETRVPDHVRDQIRIEHRVRGLTVTILECRPPWREGPGPEWTENPQARMKYDETTKAWTLYWFDRNSKAHIYDLIDPHQPIQRILGEIESDPTAIFWG